MLEHLSTPEWIVWIAGIAGEVLVLAMILWRSHWRELPVFSAYAIFCLVRSLLLLAVGNSVALYFYAYYAGVVVGGVLLLGVVVELFSFAIGPLRLFPLSDVGFMAVLSIGLLMLTLTAALLSPERGAPPWLTYLEAFERSRNWVLLVALLGIKWLSEHYEIAWPHPSYGIAKGLLIFFSCQAIVSGVAYVIPVPREWLLVSRVSFVVAQGVWIYHLSRHPVRPDLNHAKMLLARMRGAP